MLNVRGVWAILMCAGAALVVHGVTPWFRNLEPRRFPSLRIPADNPMSDEKVRLGRFLFYDRRLSMNGTIACADCHRQEFAFSDPHARSVGATGELTLRNAMTLTNVAYNGRFTWVNNTLKTLEQQARVPLLQQHPLEMGFSENEAAILQRLRADGRYQKLFARAFPDEKDTVTLAVRFASLSDGVNYPAETVLVAKAKQIQVKISNGNYQK